MKIHWLASYPKSGNTWARCLIEAYAKGFVNINLMSEVVGDGSTFYYQQASGTPIEQLSLYEWVAVRQAALLNLKTARAANFSKCILKTHNIDANITDLPLIPRGFSTSSVYLVRDPRDVVRSYAAHQGLSLDEMIEKMSSTSFGFKASSELQGAPAFLSRWDQHVTAWEQYPEVIVVRYEDLKADPVKHFSRILEQFGYEVDTKRVENAIELTRLEKLKAQEDASGFKEATAHTKFFGREHPELNVVQEDRIKELFGSVMEKYDYL